MIKMEQREKRYVPVLVRFEADGKMRPMDDIHEEIYRHVRNCLED